MLTKIYQQTGESNRVPRGQKPVIELDLAPHQYVVNVELHESRAFASLERKTCDWYWTVTIASAQGLADGGSITNELAELRAQIMPIGGTL